MDVVRIACELFLNIINHVFVKFQKKYEKQHCPNLVAIFVGVKVATHWIWILIILVKVEKMKIV